MKIVILDNEDTRRILAAGVETRAVRFERACLFEHPDAPKIE
jgi:hypothetical protein